MKLNANRVNEIFTDCLYKEGENTENHKIGKGVMMNVGFNPDRLNDYKAEINEMLADLPDSFQKSGGGGMTFLNFGIDKHGDQWADLHKTMDELVCLGNAIDRIYFPMPKDMWSILPGGVPYISIN